MGSKNVNANTNQNSNFNPLMNPNYMNMSSMMNPNNITNNQNQAFGNFIGSNSLPFTGIKEGLIIF